MAARIMLLALFASALLNCLAFAAEPAAEAMAWTRLADEPMIDLRLQSIRSLYQGSGFTPPADKQQWTSRAQALRQQVLLAAGLWPLPEKCPLNPVIHGRIDRDDYTVEKVFFQSYPGFYVTGNLYRPKGKPGPFPAVLCPHGHWADGRFYHTPDKEVQKQLGDGLEKDPDAARYPLQARCANLAKLGCVVFHYDMVGYADADPQHFPHRATFRDIESDLYAINILGLQTWDSIRALDFVCSLPDVDQSRLACTGASGGGTQTFLLMAIEDRLSAAAPVCMISAGDHQGGCVCENASYLRLFTDNVELAATFAPRPFIHPTATGDWTARFMEEGYPQIQAVYRLFGATDNVQAVRFTAGHNYNRNSRQAVYNFFNQHLKLGHPQPIVEQKFTPIEPKDLSVFDAQHPRPANAIDAPALKTYLIESAARQLQALTPTDPASLQRYRSVLGPALRQMIASELPSAEQVRAESKGQINRNGLSVEKLLISRKNSSEKLPALLFHPAKPTGQVTLVIHPQGKAALLEHDAPGPLLSALLAQGQSVLSIDCLLTGELSGLPPAPAKPVEFVAGYNRTTLANRVHDILTAIAYLKGRPQSRQVNLVGLQQAGAWCLLARALAGDALAKTAAEAQELDFRSVASPGDPNYLPAALRYGGLWSLAALAAPADLLLLNTSQAPAPLRAAYSAAGVPQRLRSQPAADPAALLRWLGQ